MGANLSTAQFKDYNEKTASKTLEKWNDAVSDSLYQDGHSYSGEIGMLGSGFKLHFEIFENLQQAEDFISEHHRKWDRAIGARYKQDGLINITIGGWCSS